MSSNFFTRPQGLHPTPQICFPPPPDTPVGNRTWFLVLDIPAGTLPWDMTYGLELHDPTLPAGTEIAYSLALPAITLTNTPIGRNDETIFGAGQVIGPYGHYIGQLAVFWANGSISRGHPPYDVIQFP